MASNMFLYWGSGSANAWKPQIVLEEKGLSGYGNKMIEFSKGEHKSAEILALNPRGQVPAFRDGDVVINESSAICMYLEDKFAKQGTRLMPENHAERALVFQRMFEVTNLYSAMINNIVAYKRITPKEKHDQELLKTRIEHLRGEFKIWDGYLAKTHAYIAGSKFTLADVSFFPLIAFAVRIGLDIGKYPALKAYYLKVKERPSVKATWPPHWKEGPGNDTTLGGV